MYEYVRNYFILIRVDEWLLATSLLLNLYITNISCFNRHFATVNFKFKLSNWLV